MAPPAAGAAFNSRSIPGTAFATWENSLGAIFDLATPNNAPAAPADCSGVEPISFDNAATSSGLACDADRAASVENACALADHPVMLPVIAVANTAAQTNLTPC